VCYEGFAWITGAAVMSAAAIPALKILLVAALYSLGAHGIMTLNDFKSIEGDQCSAVRSLPVQLGAKRAGQVACVTMALPQVAVVALLLAWGRTNHAIAVGTMLAAQVLLMRRLLSAPRTFAPWYNGTGVSLYVLGMLVTAFALKGLAS
jgi:chlorophyll synthase